MSESFHHTQQKGHTYTHAHTHTRTHTHTHTRAHTHTHTHMHMHMHTCARYFEKRGNQSRDPHRDVRDFVDAWADHHTYWAGAPIPVAV
jgi:hypothetical protein